MFTQKQTVITRYVLVYFEILAIDTGTDSCC